MFLNKYGVARHIYIPIIKRGVVDFAVGADWTPVAGDVKISKDGGAAANVTNLPTAITLGNTAMWDFSITATEMQAAQIHISVADSATKAVEDTMFIIETYGNASGQHAFDLATATQSVNVSQIDSVALSGGTGAIRGVGIIDKGTAQAATGTTLQLRSAAAFADSELIGATILINTATTGAGQRRVITAYTGSTDTATVDTWTTTPTGTITYEIYATPPYSTTNTVPANVTQWNSTNVATPDTAGYPKVTIKSGTGTGEVSLAAGLVTAGTVSDKTGYTLSNAGIDALFTRQLTESYAADGSAPTVAQALMLIQQSLGDFSISGTTLTVKKVDGATTAATFTLNSSTVPTSTTRAT